MKLYKNVLVSNSTYNLFIYLLYCSLDEIEQTFYFVGTGLPEVIAKRLKHHYYYKEIGFKKSKYFKLFFKFTTLLRWPFLKHSNIFGLDHYWFIIGNRSYTYIEDAPNIFSIYSNTHAQFRIHQSFWNSKSNFTKRIYKLFCGDVLYRHVGNNSQCKGIIQTTDDFVDYLYGKDITKLNIRKQWFLSSEEKKIEILRIFDLTSSDIEAICSKKIILFTQPFFTDHYVDKNEHLEIYRAIIENYNERDIIIKPHPRDSINYNFYFPNITVFSKPVPMQFFDLLDIKFERAVTVSSTSVISIPYDIEIDWYGNRIHPKIFDRYGDMKLSDLRR